MNADPRELGRRLVDWFEAHKRDLPWRRDRDPYRVWVSEVMLQQTRVETVVSRYDSFLRRFPTVEQLAAAAEEDVLKEWEGLGYYSRARNLWLAAREVMARYGGQLPQHPDELAKLPGIGRYTAAAIASIAFNYPSPAVDGNVLRVLARLYGIAEPVTQGAVQRRIEELAAAMMPAEQAGRFTEALMELGALVCTPGRPDCGRCPWADACVARAEGAAEALPVRPKKQPGRVVHGAVAVAVAQGTGGEVPRLLVVRRPEGGLLAGLWEFPWLELPADVSDEEAAARLRQRLQELYGVAARPAGRLQDVTHVFSHLTWRLRVFEYAVDAGAGGGRGPETGGAAWRWATADELDALPFGRAHRRIAGAWRALAHVSDPTPGKGGD
ncbi:MAG: A/G-specific adenine glycosylase [Limnochordales bacterium]|nr:A/G-specific adenine glycosylase [Bacillota bacterium]